MIQSIQDGIAQLSDNTGLDQASLKVLLCTLLSFPFSIIFKRLPDNKYTVKNLYNIAVSAFYIFGILDLKSGLGTLLFSSLGCYLITRYLRTPSMPWVNFFFLMGHLAYNHFHQQFFAEYDRNVIDITGAQMVLVMKLSAFGWNIYDGKQPRETLSKYAQSRAISHHPNIIPYIGYVFFYASLLTGPAFDYADYDRFIHSSLFDDVPDLKRYKKRRIPRSGREAMKKTMEGVFWAVVLFQLPKYVSVEYMLSDKFVKEQTFIIRIFYLWILSFFYRSKYYCIWSIAEGACILSGIGYNGYDSKTDSFKWDRVQNIDPVAFETGQNVHVCLEAWNQNTNKWLKNYIYLRVAKPGKSPGFKSTLFTFATSAFWHGTEPGYYLTFIGGALLQTQGRILRKYIRPMFLTSDGKTGKPSKRIYDFVCWVFTQLAFGFYTQPFMILKFGPSIYSWSTVYFYQLIVTLLTLFIFKGPFAKPVINFCKSFHPKVVAPTKPSKLTHEESGIVKHVVDTKLELGPTLGVPPIDVLEKIDIQELETDVQDLRRAWVSFKSRRHSIKEDDLEGLKDAYNNFVGEINEIYTNTKEELLNSTKKEKEN
ncbi:Lysophospholipid acyltransferase [Spathaspora sp. JA1]|nr:Lysophospholipid acyltransferase [Spathaspora sp. JA1]